MREQDYTRKDRIRLWMSRLSRALDTREEGCVGEADDWTMHVRSNAGEVSTSIAPSDQGAN
jgi:hypothetical protein